jgi:hypothetical protein
MASKKFQLFGFIAVVSAVFAIPLSAATREKVLFQFNGRNGSSPYAGLTSDQAGSFYGTTVNGGNPAASRYEIGGIEILAGLGLFVPLVRRGAILAPGRQELIFPGCDSGSVLAYEKNGGLAGPASSIHDLAGPAC